MAKILVTGGGGYIGSHTIVEAVMQGYDVVCIDNFYNCKPSVFERIASLTGIQIPYENIDLKDRKRLFAFFESQPDISGIIHFAALKNVRESMENPLLYYENNIGGMMNLLACVEAFSIRNFIFSSSCAVYGNIREAPVTESAPLLPAESTYGYTKQVCEQMAKDLSANHLDNRYIMLRYFNPAGAHASHRLGEDCRVDPFNLVPIIVEAAAQRLKQITVYGTDYDTRDGSCIRDYIHIQDLARAHVLALQYIEKGKQQETLEVFNLGTNTGTSVLEAICAFEKANQIQLPVLYGDRKPGDVEAIYADSQKAREQLGWKPAFSLEDIMRSAWEWEKYLSTQKKVTVRQ